MVYRGGLEHRRPAGVRRSESCTLRHCIVAVALALCSGCVNVFLHIDRHAYVYSGTRTACVAATEIFAVRPSLHSGSALEASYAHCIAFAMAPSILIDIPFEVVADTVTLPYDLFHGNDPPDDR